MQPTEFVFKDPALSGRYQFGLLLLLGCSMGFRMPCARTSRLHSSREGHIFEHHIREEMQGHGSHSWKIQEEHVEKQHILKMLFLEAFFWIINNTRIKILKQLFLMMTDCFVMGNHEVAPSFLGDVEWPSKNPFRGRPLGQFSSILSRRK